MNCMDTTDVSSSISRFEGLSRSPLLGVVQSGISGWTGRIWVLGRYNHWSKSLLLSRVDNHDLGLMDSISTAGHLVSLRLPLVH